MESLLYPQLMRHRYSKSYWLKDYTRYFCVDYAGMSESLSHIMITKDHGTVNTFVDFITVPDTYRVVIENMSSNTDYMDGETEVFKR